MSCSRADAVNVVSYSVVKRFRVGVTVGDLCVAHVSAIEMGDTLAVLCTISSGASKETATDKCLSNQPCWSERFVTLTKDDLSGYISMMPLATTHTCHFQTLPSGWILSNPAVLERSKTDVSQCDFRQIPLENLTLTTRVLMQSVESIMRLLRRLESVRFYHRTFEQIKMST